MAADNIAVDTTECAPIVSDVDKHTTLITSYDDLADEELKILAQNIETYNLSNSREVAAYVTDPTDNNTLTLETISQLAQGLNSNYDNLMQVNRIILREVIADGILGRAFECIYSNINDEYRLVFGDDQEELDEDTHKRIKEIIESFNEAVDLKSLIKDAVSVTYLEGNYPMYLRLKKDSAAIDHIPLSIAYPSEYNINRDPIVELNVSALSERLKKTYPKTKKQKKAIYFENIGKEIQGAYPDEVYRAYINKENVVKLNYDYSGCIRIGNNGRRLGVSPFFRCLKPLVVLSNIQAADVASSKSRSRKIIFQKLRKELMGEQGKYKGLSEQKLAHSEAAAALKTNFSLYTAPAYVENLEYVTDKTDTSEPELLEQYNSRLFTALGIGFADTNVANYSVANISISQLLKTINSISRQLERIIERFYQTILKEKGIEPKFAPHIQIIDSEQLDYDLRKDLAQFVYSTLNASLETALKFVGLDIEDEKRKRQKENDEGVDEIFFPRATSYTVSSGESGDVGRPSSSDDTEKQTEDKDYNKVAR